MYFIIPTIIAVFSVLKLYEMIKNLFWLLRHGRAYFVDIKIAIKGWTKETFNINDFNYILKKHGRMWLVEDWPIRRFFSKLHPFINKLFIKIFFRLTLLIACQIFILMVYANKVVIISISLILFITIWTEIVYSIANRLTFGYYDNYFIKTLSLAKYPHPNPTFDYIVPTRTELVKDFAIHFAVLLTFIIVGYTSIYHGLNTLYENSAFKNLSTGFNSILDLFYFTVVTLATVGYGDIVPNDSFIRLVVASQVIASFVLIVFLLTSFTLTVEPD